MHTTELISILNSEKAVFCYIKEIMEGLSLWLNEKKGDGFAEGLPTDRRLGKCVNRWLVDSVFLL